MAKVWSRVLQVLRENIDPHLFARNWEPLELIALDYRRLLVRCRWPREPHEPERAIALIAQAAEQAGMRRGRVVEIEAAVAARSP